MTVERPYHIPVLVNEVLQFHPATKIFQASEQELALNPAARSAKLRAVRV